MLFGSPAAAGQAQQGSARALDGLLELFDDRVLPFDTDAAATTPRSLSLRVGRVELFSAGMGSSW